MTWTNFDNTLFEDGDILTESNIVTMIGDDLMSLPHRIALDVADREVVSTTSELSIWSTTAGGVTVPADAMGANGVVRMHLIGDYLNNAAGTLTLRIKFGGSTVLTPLNTYGLGSDATRHAWWFEAVVINRGATNSQLITVRSQRSGLAGDDGANASLTLSDADAVVATAAVDTTSAQTIDITAQWSASSANLSFKKIWGITKLARN